MSSSRSSSSADAESRPEDDLTTSPRLVADLDRTLEGRFDDSIFRGLYQRNNKRGGLKNLRCFPSCSTEHRVRGFCGRSVVVTFRRAESAGGAWDPVNQYRAFVEFEEEPFEDRRPTTMTIDEMEGLLRTKTKPTNPIIEGKHCFTKDNVTVFEFNQERRGWHYSWGSNKHKCDTKHRLLCRLYEVHGNTLVLRARCASPDFVLFCRRRRRFTLEPTAVVTPLSAAVPAKDSGSKRQRRTPNQSKFAQEIELLTTVHRIESTRGVSFTGSNSGSSEDESKSDEEEEEEEEEEEKPAVTSSSKGNRRSKSRRTAEEEDVTEATHALLALTGARA